MRGVRFTKAELGVLRRLLLQYCSKDAETILDKLEAAELPVKVKSGVKVTEAIEAFREVLGNRLIVPPFSAGGVLGQMKRRLEALGLTLGDCRTIAKVAGASWRGPIRAESLVRQADRLLAEAQGELFTEEKTGGSPVELDDDEI